MRYSPHEYQRYTTEYVLDDESQIEKIISEIGGDA